MYLTEASRTQTGGRGGWHRSPGQLERPVVSITTVVWSSAWVRFPEGAALDLGGTGVERVFV